MFETRKGLEPINDILQERAELLARRRAAYLTTGEIQRLYCVKPTTIIQWARRGHLPVAGYANGRQKLFRKNDIIGILLQRMPEKLKKKEAQDR